MRLQLLVKTRGRPAARSWRENKLLGVYASVITGSFMTLLMRRLPYASFESGIAERFTVRCSF